MQYALNARQQRRRACVLLLLTRTHPFAIIVHMPPTRTDNSQPSVLSTHRTRTLVCRPRLFHAPHHTAESANINSSPWCLMDDHHCMSWVQITIVQGLLCIYCLGDAHDWVEVLFVPNTTSTAYAIVIGQYYMKTATSGVPVRVVGGLLSLGRCHREL